MKRVVFHDSQFVPPIDLNDLGAFERERIQAVVSDLLFDEARFIGLPVTASGALDITVGSGRMVVGGVIYSRDAASSISLLAYQPSTGERIVLVVATPSEVDDDPQLRKVQVEATPPYAIQSNLVVRRSYQVGISLVASAASASPSAPAVPAGGLAIAEIRLGPTGIIGDPAMVAGNRVLRLEDAVAAIAILQAQDAKNSVKLETLSTDLAAIGQQIRSKASAEDVNRLIGDLLRLKERLGVPDTASFWGYDNFTSADETDTTFAGYAARVGDGVVTMPELESSTSLVALVNALDPALDIASSGLITPKAQNILRISCDDKDGSIAISSYPVTTITAVKKTLSRQYLYYAKKGQTKSMVEQSLKKAGNLALRNPTTGAIETVNIAGKTWSLAGSSNAKVFRLTIQESYWDKETVIIASTGSRVAQTILVAQSGYHRRLQLGFTDVASTGDILVKVCETLANGTPDLNSVIASATVSAGNTNRWPNWTNFDFEPFYLHKGKRYAFVISTPGNHKLALSKSNGYGGGSLLYQPTGDKWDGDVGFDACFRLYGMRYAASRVVVQIGDLTLAGGIRELQAVFTGYQPAGTDLILEVKATGGQWRTVGEEDETILNSAPTQLQCRLIFLGSLDLMPAINLAASRIYVSRPATAAVHVSTVRSLPSGTTTSITVEERSLDYDAAAGHTWSVKLLTGASYATEVNPASSSIRADPDGGYTLIAKFTVAALSSWRIKTLLGASSAASIPSVTARRDQAA